MPESAPSPLHRAGLLCRSVVVSLLSGWLTGQEYRQVEKRIAARPVAEQAILVGGVLTVLFVLAILAAHGGLIGMALYGLAIVIVAR